jgi:photosystem II stability/assembly factor-like uncharacterized protein
MLSENGGRTWQDVMLSTDNIDSPVMALFYEQDTQLLFAVRYNGHLASSPDGGTTWQPLPSLPAEGCPLSLQITHKASHANHFYLLHGESERNVLYLGNPNHGDWRELASDTLEEHEPCVLSVAADSGNVYALTPGGVLTIDIEGGGEKGVAAKLLVGSPANGQALVIIPGNDPTQPALVVGTPDGLWTSADGGATWQAAELPNSGGVTALDRDPERRDRLYAGTDTGYIFESGNRGQTWQPVTHTPTHPIQCLYVVRI